MDQNFDGVTQEQPSPLQSLYHRPLKQLIIGFLALLVVFPALIYGISRMYEIPFFTAAKPFTIANSSPTNYGTQFPVVGQPTFVFTKKLSIEEKDLGNYFSISPSVKGTWKLEKNKQVVYFATEQKAKNGFSHVLAYDTVYTITIKKHVPAQNAETLNKDAVFTFRTETNPKFPYFAQKKLMMSVPDQPISIDIIGNEYTTNTPIPSDPVKVSVATATLDQLLSYFTYKEGQYQHLYEYVPDTTTKQVFQTTSKLEGRFLQLPGIHTPGLYYVTFSNQYGQEDLFINVTTQAGQVFSDDNSMYVWATNNATGKSVAKADISYYTLNNTPKKLGAKTANEKGYTSFALHEDKIDLVITKNDNNFTITESLGDTSILQRTPYHAYGYTDRPVYKPGDTLHFKAVVRKQEKGVYTMPNGTFYLQLQTTENIAKEHYVKVTLDKNGTITQDFILPPAVDSQYQTIGIYTKNGDKYEHISSTSFEVSSYTKPDMEITAKAAKKEYISKDQASVAVSAQTLYGQPLTNVDFTYQVILDTYYERKDNTQSDFTGYYGSGGMLTSGKGKFNDDGIATIAFNTDLVGFEQSQAAVVEIIPNIGASPSIGKSPFIIHRGEFALFFDNTIEASTSGITGSLEVLTHDSPRKPVADVSISLDLLKVGNYGQSVLVTTTKGTTNAQGETTFTFNSSALTPGSYDIIAKATDKRGNVVTQKTSAYIPETADQKTAPTQSQKFLHVSAPKHSLKPKEKTTISITADVPTQDIAIVTTTTASYKATIVDFRVEQNKNGVSLPVQIPANQQATYNVFAFATYQQAILENSIDLEIDTKDNEVKTTITFDKKSYKPKDKVTVTLTTKNSDGKGMSADISLAVIDRAIYQIANATGNIFASFYPSYQSYGYLTHANSLSGIYNDQLGGGGGGCFLSGTQITMADGTTKSIEDVVVGDMIATRERDGNPRLIADKVTKVHQHVVEEYLMINGSLAITPIHRVLLNNRWQPIENAVIGDRLSGIDGNDVVISTIEKRKEKVIVYNLTTETYHTFFAGGMYVHNDKGGDARTNFVDTAYWNPHIQTDDNGKASVSFTAPDNLTTFSATAVTNKDTYFGQQTAQFIIQKPLAIVPAIPSFYYTGDKAMIGALLHNNEYDSFEGTVTLSVNDTKIKDQTLTLKKGDIEKIAFPYTIGSDEKPLSITLSVTNKSGKTDDSITIPVPVLPQGVLHASWESIEDNGSATFTPTYPQLDFNTVGVMTYPHSVEQLRSQKLITSYISEPTEEGAQSIYAAAQVVYLTQEGALPPDFFDYADVKNNLRTTVTSYLANTKKDSNGNSYWQPPDYEQDSALLTTLWTLHALNAMKQTGLGNDISNLDEILSQTNAYLKGRQHDTMLPIDLLNIYRSDKTPVAEETIMRAWVLGEKPQSDEDTTTPAYLAIQLLRGETSSAKALLEKRLNSANDRYIWDGNTIYDKVLPALALVQKGSKADAAKALRGLAVREATQNYYGNSSPLEVLVGVLDAKKQGYTLSDHPFTLSLNGTPLFTTVKKASDDDDNPYRSTFVLPSFFTQQLLLKTIPEQRAAITVTTAKSYPQYTDFYHIDYQDTDGVSFFQRMLPKNIFGNATQEKRIEANIHRNYRDLFSQKKIDQVKEGVSAAVVLSVSNPFADNGLIYTGDSLYKTVLVDAIMPSLLYLDQTSGNSPQFQNLLNTLFTSNDYQPSDPYYNDYPPLSVYPTPTVFPTPFDASPPATLEKQLPPVPSNFPALESEVLQQYSSSYGNRVGYLTPQQASNQALFFDGTIPSPTQETLYFPYIVYGVSSGSYYQPPINIVFPYVGVIIDQK